MNTIAEQLTQLAQIKSDIKDAIISKGVSVSDSDGFASYAEKIQDISSSGGGGGSVQVQFIYMISSGYYVAPDGTATSVPLDTATGMCSFSCMPGSLIYVEGVSNTAISSLSGASIIYSTSHGSRGTMYVRILQANAQ